MTGFQTMCEVINFNVLTCPTGVFILHIGVFISNNWFPDVEEKYIIHPTDPHRGYSPHRGIYLPPQGCLFVPHGCLFAPQGCLFDTKGCLSPISGFQMLEKNRLSTPQTLTEVIRPTGVFICPPGVFICPTWVFICPTGVNVVGLHDL